MSNTYEYKDFNTVKRFIMYVKKILGQSLSTGAEYSLTENTEFNPNDKDAEHFIRVSGSFISNTTYNSYKGKYFSYYFKVIFHPIQSNFSMAFYDEDDNCVFDLHASELHNDDLHNTLCFITSLYGVYSYY